MQQLTKRKDAEGAFKNDFSYQRKPGFPPKGSMLTEDITIVTAYTDLGQFQKGETFLYYEPDLYRRWMAAFQNLSNPVIGYFDDEEDVRRFQSIRSKYHSRTSLVVPFERKDTWAFSIRPKISQIFKQPSYPVHHPNTVDSNYSSAMHLKYEVLSHAVHLNPFRTKYFAWLDVGYFRDLLHFRNSSMYSLKLPPAFDKSCIAVNEVFKRNDTLTAKEIIHNNLVWLGGGFFIGTIEVMRKWVNQYKMGVEHFLDEMMMNTDQQVIYAWLNTADSVVPIQVYKSHGSHNPWFHLGYVCKEEGDKTLHTTQSQNSKT